MSMSPPPPPPPGPPPSPTPGWGAAPPPGYPTSYPAQPAAGGQLAGFGSRLGGSILDHILYGIAASAFVVRGPDGPVLVEVKQQHPQAIATHRQAAVLGVHQAKNEDVSDFFSHFFKSTSDSLPVLCVVPVQK